MLSVIDFSNNRLRNNWDVLFLSELINLLFVLGKRDGKAEAAVSTGPTS